MERGQPGERVGRKFTYWNLKIGKNMGILEEPHERQVCWNEEREEHRSKYDLGTDQKKNQII